MTWRPAFWLCAAGVVVADQATKVWALRALTPGDKHELLGNLLSIQLVRNSGAAFSLGHQSTWILTIVALLVTAGIVFYARRAQATWSAVVFGIALGGAVGNLIDRLFREPSFGQGHVVDMINYGDQFIGNVADIAIVGAAIALVIAGLLSKPVLAPAEGEQGDDAPDAQPHPDGADPRG
ncbi:signal peptidase II [Demequina iriomotensis]|uniref:signal peptidase II n=1 Tax=Demequina iriomotensis TaxID=1536641 RepID=UPI0009E1F81B|nr:signal peptidase II [Demequina iriomotensis]